MELVYVRKIDSYKDLIHRASIFSNDVNDEANFFEFRQAIMESITIASEDVFTLIAHKEEGILHLGTKVYKEENKTEQEKYKKIFNKSLDKVAFAIRKDLQKFSGK